MAASTTKKAVIRRFEKESLAGYVNPISYLQITGVELLTAQGSVSLVPYPEIKMVAFVRDLESAVEPGRQLFQNRPKMEGLWVRMHFRDGDAMDGMLANNLLQLDTYGVSVIPPDPGFQNQRVFVPKAALSTVQVLGVVGSPLRIRKPKQAVKEQIEMFDKQG